MACDNWTILAVAAFILFAFVIKLPFLETINSSDLVSESAKKVFDKIGSAAFIRNNEFMLAIFAASIILWMTEAIPNYLTSLLLIISLVLTGVLSKKLLTLNLGIL